MKKRTAALAILAAGLLAAQDAKVTSLISKELTGSPGKEGLMIVVDYPPGAADPIHRHNAHAFIYVLEGSIVMQVKGGQQVTLTQGQTYYEGPDDEHIVGRNASKTQPAKFVVFLVKEKGTPVLIPIRQRTLRHECGAFATVLRPGLGRNQPAQRTRSRHLVSPRCAVPNPSRHIILGVGCPG